jgi:hypothetical protein
MRHIILAAALLGLGSSVAVANPITVNIPQPSGGGFDYFGSGDASVTYSGVTFSQSSALSNGAFFNVGTSFSGSPPVISSQGQSFGSSNILITLPSLASGLSVSYGTFGGSQVTFLLSDGSSSTLSSTGSAYDTPDLFTSGSGLFNWVLLTSNDFVLNVGSVTYNSGSSAAPEPGTWLLMIGGFGAVGALQRRHKRAVSFARA